MFDDSLNTQEPLIEEVREWLAKHDLAVVSTRLVPSPDAPPFNNDGYYGESLMGNAIAFTDLRPDAPRPDAPSGPWYVENKPLDQTWKWQVARKGHDCDTHRRYPADTEIVVAYLETEDEANAVRDALNRVASSRGEPK